MRNEVSKNRLGWFALMASFTALSILTYLKYKFVFHSGNFAGRLVLATFFFTGAAIILGFVSVRQWQGVVSLLISAFVAYFLLFTPLYAVP